MHTSIQSIPLGLTFVKSQSSKLESLFFHVSVNRDVRALSFEPWKSFRKCHPTWDWLKYAAFRRQPFPGKAAYMCLFSRKRASKDPYTRDVFICVPICRRLGGPRGCGTARKWAATPSSKINRKIVQKICMSVYVYLRALIPSPVPAGITQHGSWLGELALHASRGAGRRAPVSQSPCGFCFYFLWNFSYFPDPWIFVD